MFIKSSQDNNHKVINTDNVLFYESMTFRNGYAIEFKLVTKETISWEYVTRKDRDADCDFILKLSNR